MSDKSQPTFENFFILRLKVILPKSGFPPSEQWVKRLLSNQEIMTEALETVRRRDLERKVLYQNAVVDCSRIFEKHGFLIPSDFAAEVAAHCIYVYAKGMHNRKFGGRTRGHKLLQDPEYLTARVKILWPHPNRPPSPIAKLAIELVRWSHDRGWRDAIITKKGKGRRPKTFDEKFVDLLTIPAPSGKGDWREKRLQRAKMR